jgi:nucleotide sugar dehydrogenase
MIKTICVVGLGYVGLPTAVAFSKAGYNVIGADVNESLISKLSSGKSSIPEILDDEIISKLLSQGTISFTTDTPKAVSESDAILITVPTPVHEDKTPDLSYVESSARTVAKGMASGKLVVLESTVYPGVTEEIVEPEIRAETGMKAGEDYGLAYCPERYNPGDKEHTIASMSRVVGAINKKWLDIASEMYSKITEKPVTKVSNIKTAEAAKVIENTQRDLNIGLMNELALIFDKMGVDTREVIDAASTKWNFHKYYPGPGVGGHCLPVDPHYLVYKARELGYQPKIITAGREVNDYMAEHVVNLLLRGFKEKGFNPKGSTVGLLGASYKGNVGDSRESPAKRIAEKLKSQGINVRLYDPFSRQMNLSSWPIELSENLEGAFEGVDALILHSDHDSFRSLPLDKMAVKMNKKLIVDTRAFIDPKKAQSLGFLLLRI